MVHLLQTSRRPPQKPPVAVEERICERLTMPTSHELYAGVRKIDRHMNSKLSDLRPFVRNALIVPNETGVVKQMFSFSQSFAGVQVLLVLAGDVANSHHIQQNMIEPSL